MTLDSAKRLENHRPSSGDGCTGSGCAGVGVGIPYSVFSDYWWFVINMEWWNG